LAEVEKMSRALAAVQKAGPASEVASTPRTHVQTERPRLYKVILLNDGYTPREFVVAVLKG
jgi:ATP-dependent Clp protease adaptor protein ClpS